MAEHVRIDEGIARPTHNQPPIARPLEGDSWTIPDNLDPDAILQRYLTEGKTSGIAKDYGLRRAALTRWLQKVRPVEWKEVQVIRALCTKEDGTEQIYDAETALQLARGRELRRASEWDLERLDPSNYGPKQEVTITDNRQLQGELRAADERVIDAEVVKEPVQQLENCGSAEGDSSASK